jgi:hypothetical protein
MLGAVAALAIALPAAIGAAWYTTSDPSPDPVEITVYKNPSCGCCKAWVSHMREKGYAVQAKDLQDLSALKKHYGITDELAACHTAFVGGYVIEGHVPADAIARLLKEHPKGVKGLAVPGMPMGSPGMEGPTAQHYDVIAFDSTGATRVFAHK